MKNNDNQDNNPETKGRKNLKISEIIEPLIGLVFSFVFIVLFNVYYHDIHFLTKDFDKIKTLYNFSLIMGIIFNASRIFISGKGYKVITDFISLAFFLVIAYKFWVIYPFDTSVIGDQKLWDRIFKVLIIFPPLMAILGNVVNIIKYSLNTTNKK